MTTSTVRRTAKAWAARWTAVALASLGAVAAAAPATGADIYSTENYQIAWQDHSGVNLVMEIGPLHRYNGEWFSFVGEKVTSTLYFSRPSGTTTVYHECAMREGPVWKEWLPRSNQGKSQFTMTSLPASSDAHARCLGFSGESGYIKKDFWWRIYRTSTTPSITTGMTGGGSYSAGTAVSGGFTYSHATYLPYSNPSVQWQVTPSKSQNVLTTSGNTYRFIPKVPGTYTVSAKVVGGANNPGNVSTGATIVVNPARVDSITVTPRDPEPRRNSTVIFEPVVQDTEGNTITSNPNDVFFSSSEPTDSPILGGVAFGPKSGPRTITATYSSMTTRVDIDVFGEPVVMPPAPLSVAAGESVSKEVHVDAHPADVEYSCALPDALESLTWTGNTVSAEPSRLGTATATCVPSNSAGVGESFPVTLAVGPGPAATMSIDQAGSTHVEGTPVRLTWTVADQFGNPADAAKVKVGAISSSVAADRIDLAGKKITLVGAGSRTVTVAATHSETGRSVIGRATVKATAAPRPNPSTPGAGGQGGSSGTPGGTTPTTPSAPGTPPNTGNSGNPGLPVAPDSPGSAPPSGTTPGEAGAPGLGTAMPAGQASALAPAPGGAHGSTAIVPGNVLTIPAAIASGASAVSYQWYRSGSPISGATGPTHKIRAADAGHKLSVTVTRNLGGTIETFTLRALAVPKLTPKVTLSPTIRSGRPAVVVKVSAPQGVRPTGTLVVKAGGTRAVVSLKASHRGKSIVALPKVPRGKTIAIKVTYKGSKSVKAKTLKAKGRWA